MTALAQPDERRQAASGASATVRPPSGSLPSGYGRRGRGLAPSPEPHQQTGAYPGCVLREAET